MITSVASAQPSSGASCSSYEKIAKMAAAKFVGEQTRDYGIIFTEIVGAYPGAKACTRINSSSDTPDYNVDGLHCRFAEVGAEASARHAKIVQELKACHSKWTLATEDEPTGGQRVTFTGADPLKSWKVDLLPSRAGVFVVDLKYELMVAAPAALPPGYGK